MADLSTHNAIRKEAKRLLAMSIKERMEALGLRYVEPEEPEETAKEFEQTEEQQKQAVQQKRGSAEGG